MIEIERMLTSLSVHILYLESAPSFDSCISTETLLLKRSKQKIVPFLIMEKNKVLLCLLFHYELIAQPNQIRMVQFSIYIALYISGLRDNYLCEEIVQIPDEVRMR